MLINFLLFSLSILLLYLSSQALLNQLIKLFYRLTRSKSTAVDLLFFLLLPGIFLHEFSHILAAAILRVPTGHLSLKPQIKDNQLKLGSAQIAQTDPFRLTLIGTAPFLTASFTLWAVLKLGLNLNPSHLSFTLPTSIPPLLIVLFFYLLFAVANTMFSSSSDLQSAGLPLILILITAITLRLTHLSLPSSLTASFISLLSLLSSLFIFILALNLILLLFIKLIQNMLH